jgi:thiamine biosynthesis protein ThiI
MMRRGATVIGLHFSGRPQTSAASEQLVAQIAETLRPAGGLKRLLIVAFGEYQRQIAASVPASLRVIFYRRLMVAVANRVAAQNGARALVTGESLGQVASQTLENIQVIDAVTELPILRPLIGSDKQEIITEAQRLGTYDISIQNHEDCCTLFMPRNPETRARLNVVDPIWAKLPVAAWLDEILLAIEESPLS